MKFGQSGRQHIQTLLDLSYSHFAAKLSWKSARNRSQSSNEREIHLVKSGNVWIFKAVPRSTRKNVFALSKKYNLSFIKCPKNPSVKLKWFHRSHCTCYHYYFLLLVDWKYPCNLCLTKMNFICLINFLKVINKIRLEFSTGLIFFT